MIKKSIEIAGPEVTFKIDIKMKMLSIIFTSENIGRLKKVEDALISSFNDEIDEMSSSYIIVVAWK